MTRTSTTYTNLELAYNHFNGALFDDKLPEVLLTLVPHKGAYGYYRHEAFTLKEPNKPATKVVRMDKIKKAKVTTIHELALNPFTFMGRTDQEIMGTLVHEMVHMWQMLYGEKKPKKPGHNREWADKMKSIGLHPSTTGAPGGKETGRRCSHYIVEGPFTKAAKACRIKFDFAGVLVEKEKKGSKRTKYTCPECDTNAYGKEGINIRCGDCDQEMTA